MTKNLYRSLFKTISFALLAASVAILSGCSGGSDSGSSSAVQPIYTAIFDAGSSGTRLSFYKVIPGNGGYPSIEKIATYDDDIDGVVNDDGINDFLNGAGSIKLGGEGLPSGCPGTSGLGQLDVEPCVLQPLLAQLNAAIANQNTLNPKLNLQKSQVTVELFATAGMRTEDIRNGGKHTSSEIDQYYKQMKSYVSSQGYKAGEFKTINGNSEEGVWTWANLNDYYFNSFGGNPTVSKTSQPPVGDFEVGGSSMQIAFPTNASPNPDANVYSVSINGRTYNVYSKTFLGLGADDTRKYVKAYNYSSNIGGANCYPSTVNTVEGLKLINESSGILLYPSNQLSSTQPTYPFPTNLGVTPSPGWTSLSATALTLRGTASFNSTCSDQYNVIINQVTALDRNKYGTESLGSQATMANFKAAIQSSIAPFYGIDNFFFSANDLKYAPTSGFDPAIFYASLMNHCTNGNTPVIGKKTSQTCPNGTYMYNYLFGPSGLFNGSTASFAGVLNPRDSNDETVLTWTRGYLLIKYAN